MGIDIFQIASSYISFNSSISMSFFGSNTPCYDIFAFNTSIVYNLILSINSNTLYLSKAVLSTPMSVTIYGQGELSKTSTNIFNHGVILSDTLSYFVGTINSIPEASITYT
jgi:hypothetical protein